MLKETFVSIVIPTFNEAEDIKKTLDACLALDHPLKEIIVVDDSTDETPAIVGRYEKIGPVRLIKREKNFGGRCGARNDGILAAKGEVVVILNADVILPPDFIIRILEHYAAGADYVLVNAEVINQENVFARFVEALHRFHYRNEGDYSAAEWTEGFSCRKSVVIAIGLFPTPPVKLTAGEDGYFGKKLKVGRYKKAVDLSITVKHFAPHRFRDFWRIQKERVSAIASFFLEEKSLLEIFVRAAIRTFITVLGLALIVPAVFTGFRLSHYSSRRFRDVFLFACLYFIQQSAFIYGKWSSFLRLLSYQIQKHQS